MWPYICDIWLCFMCPGCSALLLTEVTFRKTSQLGQNEKASCLHLPSISLCCKTAEMDSLMARLKKRKGKKKSFKGLVCLFCEHPQKC